MRLRSEGPGRERGWREPGTLGGCCCFATQQQNTPLQDAKTTPERPSSESRRRPGELGRVHSYFWLAGSPFPCAGTLCCVLELAPLKTSSCLQAKV